VLRIGELDPCASIEFSRGCPWDCSFCSAWTFYGRTYRKASPEAAAAELASIREPRARRSSTGLPSAKILRTTTGKQRLKNIVPRFLCIGLAAWRRGSHIRS
jgi:hypothetical protein